MDLKTEDCGHRFNPNICVKILEKTGLGFVQYKVIPFKMSFTELLR